MVATLIYFGLFMISFAMGSDSVSFEAKIAFSVVPQVALTQLCSVFIELEFREVGLNLHNINHRVNNYEYFMGIIMLVISQVFFLLLAFYFKSTTS